MAGGNTGGLLPKGVLVLGRDPLRASIDRINGIRFQCEVIVAAEEVAGGGSDVADCGHGREHIGVMV
jgi:hypothetical protein